MKNKYDAQAKEAQAKRAIEREKEKEKKMCTDKVAYASRKLAHIEGQVSYKCDYCRLYHNSTKVPNFIEAITKPKIKPANKVGKKKKPFKKKGLGKVIFLKGKPMPIIKRH